MCWDSAGARSLACSHHPRFIHPAAANNTPSSSRTLGFLYIKQKHFTHSSSSAVEVAVEQGIFMPFKLLPSNCVALATPSLPPQRNEPPIVVCWMRGRESERVCVQTENLFSFSLLFPFRPPRWLFDRANWRIYLIRNRKKIKNNSCYLLMLQNFKPSDSIMSRVNNSACPGLKTSRTN